MIHSTMNETTLNTTITQRPYSAPPSTMPVASEERTFTELNASHSMIIHTRPGKRPMGRLLRALPRSSKSAMNEPPLAM